MGIVPSIVFAPFFFSFCCNEIATLKVRCDVKLWCSPRCAPIVVSVCFLSVNKLLLTKFPSCFLLFIIFHCSSRMYILPNWLCTVMRPKSALHVENERCMHSYLGHHLRSKRCSSVTCGFSWPVRTFLRDILYLFHCSSSFESSVMRKSAASPVDSSRQIGHFYSAAAVC